MKKELLFLLIIPTLASGCYSDHTFMVYTLRDIVGISMLVALILAAGGLVLYAYISDWLRNRKRRKRQNSGN